MGVGVLGVGVWGGVRGGEHLIQVKTLDMFMAYIGIERCEVGRQTSMWALRCFGLFLAQGVRVLSGG